MLYLIPTPIGNLRDITLRALDILKECSLIICEDTRESQKLLSAYEIKKPLLAFHEHSSEGRLREILQRLKAGEMIAWVTDGGMPSISDPGFEIVREVIREKIPFTVLPGANALTTALVASGLATDSFSFFGFPPQKSAQRQKMFKEMKMREETLIFYESPFRLVKSLTDMQLVWGEREAAICRELSKKFEEVTRGYFSEILAVYSKRKVLGEIVIVVSGKNRKQLFKM